MFNERPVKPRPHALYGQIAAAPTSTLRVNPAAKIPQSHYESNKSLLTFPCHQYSRFKRAWQKPEDGVVSLVGRYCSGDAHTCAVGLRRGIRRESPQSFSINK